MSSIICNSCQTPSAIGAKFCFECGSTLNCKKCHSPLVKGAKFCAECGEDLRKSATSTNQANTLSYHKKGDEVRCDVSVSDEVGKEGFKTLVQSLAQGGNPQHYVLTTSDKDNEDIVYKLENESTKVQNKKEPETIEVSSQHPTTAEIKTHINYPHIDDLLRRKKFTEMEWLLIFAFYESGNGINSFTKEQIKDAYLNKRKNESRVKNFSGNWNGLRKIFFNTVSEDVFTIEYAKLNQVSDLIEGKIQNITAGAYENKKSPRDKKVKNEKTDSTSKPSVPAKQIAFEEFDVIKNDIKPSLQDFYAQHKPNNNKLIFGMIAFYITTYNKSEFFTAGNIDYAYKILKITRKNNLIQLINNTKNETLWFEGISSGSWKLNRFGEVELEKLFGQ